ncbi:MAG: cob(I)yrinic acid a,c-diamide adenosyltransferase [Bacteroidetes bacterium]|nr:cob(I)yrinic acid a,c-diamide adenosyltransferase [Bacteroidota bacterium]
MKIYTGIGDEGKTNILGENGVSKSESRIEAYGNVDELNSYIGWISTFETVSEYKPQLREIQNRLFDIGTELAATEDALTKLKFHRIEKSDIEKLELSIDEMTTTLPDLKAFILPGSCAENAACHIARTVCRRAERSIVLHHKHHPVQKELLVFMNRLSDYLFTLARVVSVKKGVSEIEWKSK